MNRVGRIFSALMPSDNNNTMSHSNNNSNSNNPPPSSDDDDEMSADLLSRESESVAVNAVPPPRSSLRSDACVWNSARKQQQKLASDNCNSNDDAASVLRACPNKKRAEETNDDTQQANNDDENNKKSPWRNFGKSYARRSARNPANYTTSANNDSANSKDGDGEINDGDDDDRSAHKKKETTFSSPTPPSNRKKAHPLTRRLRKHAPNPSVDPPIMQFLQPTTAIIDHHYQNHFTSASPMGQEIQIVDDNQNNLCHSRRCCPHHNYNNHDSCNNNNKEEEECHYGGLSPLTCPSQLYGLHADSDDDDKEQVEEEEKMVQETEKTDADEEEKEEDYSDNINENHDGKVINDNGDNNTCQSNNNKAATSPSSSSYEEHHHQEEDQDEEEVVESTLVQNYTAALKAGSSNNNNTNTHQKCGSKRKPTPLDLALIEESVTTKKNANGNSSSGRNNNKRKIGVIAAALAAKDDSQTPPYELINPRNNNDGVEEEEEEKEDVVGKEMMETNDHLEQESRGGYGNNNEVNFSFSGDNEEEELTETEKQSEALLSSPSLQPPPPVETKTTKAVAAAVVDSAVAGRTSAKTTDELVLSLHDLCNNYLGKALTCPICQFSLKEAQMLPCCHAFCKSCLAKTFSPTAAAFSSNDNSNNKRRKGSPPPTAFKICPTCKKPADRRSVVPIPQLDDQVKAYKQILKVFGFAPFVYGNDIAMTQLGPEDSVGDDILVDENDYRQCLQTSLTVHSVFARKNERVQAEEEAAAATTTTTADLKPSDLRTRTNRKPRAEQQKQQQQQQRLTKDQMESQHEIRRWKQLMKEQENVVKVNQDAFSKVKSQARQLVQRKLVQAETAKFVADVAAGLESKVAGVVVEKRVESTVADRNDSDDEVDFCTAPDAESVEYDTAKESQGLSLTNTSLAMSPTVIHDGNTVKKAERSPNERSIAIPGSRVLDLEVSPEAQKLKEGRDSLGTLTTARTTTSPIVLHDGNTVRKAHPGNKGDNYESSTFHVGKTPLSSGNFLRCEGVAVKHDDEDATQEEDDEEEEYVAETESLYKSAPLKSSQDEESEYGDETQPIIGKPTSKPADQENPAAAIATSVDEISQREQIIKGSVVLVQARTWPGINKHGGVGRVTKVHSCAESGGNAVKYDVAYVLGGKEKCVDESFVRLHNTIDEESSTTMSNSLKHRNSSEKMESRRPKRTQQKVTFKEEIRIYKEEELKHIPPEALEWAGIVPKKDKGKKKVAGKKRALAESNDNTKTSCSSIKKQKSAAVAAPKTALKPKNKAKPKNVTCEERNDEESGAVEDLNDIISSLSTREIVQFADERYSSLISAGGDSNISPVLHLVTSNLSDEESDSLNELCKLLKDKSISLKPMKSFKANKTQLCITSASVEKQPNANQPINVVSNARTMKVMRTTLAGLPILSPRWVEACLNKGEIVAPTSEMCVRTLPRKQDDHEDGYNDRFGVTKYAAAFQKGMQSNKLLTGFEVLMCGTYGGSSGKDIMELLQDAGATIVKSESVASRILSGLSSDEGKSQVDTMFVFLCDNSPMDKSCGISDLLFKQAKKICDDSEDATVMAVHFSWLFDCISCAMVMPATSYEPIAPRAKSLWRLAVGGGVENRGKKSQAY